MGKKRKKGTNVKQRKHESVSREERTDRLVLEGTVEKAMPGTLFLVKVSDTLTVTATLAGKLHQYKIRVLPGDRVTVEVSPYDPSRGRITWRGR